MSSQMESEPPDEGLSETQRSHEQVSTLRGDRRWPGASREDLLGQRAHQRSTGEIEGSVVTAGDGEVSIPELPTLEDDVYLLEPDVTGGRRRRKAVISSLHALSLDTALSAGGDVVWIDAQGHATTHTLASIAPSERALERVHVARAFTTHQHHTLVEQIHRWFRGAVEGPFGSPSTDRPAVLVCPALDSLYRAGALNESASRELLVRALAVLAAAARDQNLPVLVTRTRNDDYAAPIEQASITISLEQTKFGPRFECDALEFETLVYPVDEGIVQTTFAFWREILGTRHPEVASTSGTETKPTPATTVVPGQGGW
ncbi:hypothetical protein [Salinigranum salinum]|uniref:hypothetical protein n=1 Tax=Salinigranum salinum TaxID=1364937 RepID=UPI00126112A6|nr:hypothetical protein [Salinigranum salinum]